MSIVDIEVPRTVTIGKSTNRMSTSKSTTVTYLHKEKKKIAFENAKKNLKIAASKLDW